MAPLFLSVDCGSQSLRLLIFNSEGKLIQYEQIKYNPYFSDKPNWAEQDPEIFWKSLIKAAHQLKQKSKPDLWSKIISVCITTQRDTVINLDKKGNILRPAIMWMDRRKARPPWTPGFLLKAATKLIGMDETIIKTQMDGKTNWIKQNQPDIWEKTLKVLQVSGYLNYKLTGEFHDSNASQIGHIPFNYKKIRWSTPGELTGKMFPIERNKLPRLFSPGEQLGTITKKAAAATGISEGTPVIAGASDKGCETLGMGVINSDQAALSFGTTATIQTTSPVYFETLKHMPSYPAALPNYFNPEIEIFRGFWMVEWFKKQFAHSECTKAEKLGIEPENLLNEYLVDIPAGSMGLMVLPYWTPALKEPSSKGAILGFGDVHTRAHVYKALIEGLNFALYEGMKKIEKRGKVNIKNIMVSGGGARSNEICQICSDIFNKKVTRGQTHETAGLGAAIISARGMGIYDSWEQAAAEMVNYGETFTPNKENVKLYSQLYNQVYSSIFEQLKPLYRDIRKITGYPEKIK
ncbi:MAG: FGGY-family carbohydrate kinase [Deltaproteobacteria bacterium]|jgi:sugar (pentulose or hexulose) kinase|nr:FGGY-family carbohydrate kinase [Deltaproteobacteria bacterium]